ncbi:MAG: hypothetical protein II850_07585 [Fibrobacter sp.]|nr:hypothetical protein [Fibrobacter sp.]
MGRGRMDREDAREHVLGGMMNFERIKAPDGLHEDVESNEYRTTNAVALALIGASVGATIIGVALLAVIL